MANSSKPIKVNKILEAEISAQPSWKLKSAQLLQRATLPGLIVVFSLLILELLIRGFEISNYLLPPPSRILQQLYVHWETIAPNLQVTIIEAVCGFVVATVLAIGLATVFLYLPLVERGFYPFVVVFQTIPVIIMTPVLIVVFGNGMGPKILIAAIITFFPTLINMNRGLKAVDPLMLDLFKVMNATQLQTFIKLRFPASLPYLFSSLKIASVNCFIGAIVGEWIGASEGIGYLSQLYLYQLNIDRLYAAVVASSLAAIIFSGLISFAEGLICRWQNVTIDRQ